MCTVSRCKDLQCSKLYIPTDVSTKGVGAYILREGEGHEPNDSVLSGFSRA